MSEQGKRKLLKGPLTPISHSSMSHRSSYSQPVFTKGEIGFERKTSRKASKGQPFLPLHITPVGINASIDVLFSSSQLPQPFLDPKVMARRRAQQEKA